VAPRPLALDAKAAKWLGEEMRPRLLRLAERLRGLEDWSPEALERLCRRFAEEEGIGFGRLAQPLRAALTGTTVSPGLFEVMRVLGREETLLRLSDAAAGRNPDAREAIARGGGSP